MSHDLRTQLEETIGSIATNWTPSHISTNTSKVLALASNAQQCFQQPKSLALLLSVYIWNTSTDQIW